MEQTFQQMKDAAKEVHHRFYKYCTSSFNDIVNTDNVRDLRRVVIRYRGIVMTGGSSLLRNLDRLLSKETGMPVYVSDDALSCVALGTGIAVENVDIYKKGFMASNNK